MPYDPIDSSEYSPEYRTVEHIIAASNWIQAELTQSLSKFDITLAQFNVLQVLYSTDPERKTCSDIGRQLLDRTPDVTRLLDRMEKHDLVDRRRAKHDRRIVEVGITAHGKKVIEEVQQPVGLLIERLTSPLSNVEHRLLTEYLARLQSGRTVIR